MLFYHAMDFSSQLRNGIDGLVATEGLCGDNEARRHRHPVQVEVLQMVSLVADKHLVVHHRGHFPEGANQHLRVVGHDVADKLGIQGGFHGTQRIEYASNEIV